MMKIKQRKSMKRFISLITILLFFALSETVFAQFEEPEIVKVEYSERQNFEDRFEDIKWTGQGLYNNSTIDRIPTIELRSRLQAAFGDPTQTIGDLINSNSFRPGKAIQFEYWFIVDGEMPLMILDLDGPFANGLVYVGASRYIDLMPQVKRTLNRMLMGDEGEPAEYSDYFYSPERDEWYLVKYEDGEYSQDPISRPTF
jgi:hypothetical protein